MDAQEAYDAFLEHFPYCYGYWKKFADLELKRGSIEAALKVRCFYRNVRDMVNKYVTCVQ